MFAFSIALLALAVIFGLFGVVGIAGGVAIAASIILLMMSGLSMVVYWRRRPA